MFISTWREELTGYFVTWVVAIPRREWRWNWGEEQQVSSWHIPKPARIYSRAFLNISEFLVNGDMSEWLRILPLRPNQSYDNFSMEFGSGWPRKVSFILAFVYYKLHAKQNYYSQSFALLIFSHSHPRPLSRKHYLQSTQVKHRVAAILVLMEDDHFGRHVRKWLFLARKIENHFEFHVCADGPTSGSRISRLETTRSFFLALTKRIVASAGKDECQLQWMLQILSKLVLWANKSGHKFNNKRPLMTALMSPHHGKYQNVTNISVYTDIAWCSSGLNTFECTVV